MSNPRDQFYMCIFLPFLDGSPHRSGKLEVPSERENYLCCSKPANPAETRSQINPPSPWLVFGPGSAQLGLSRLQVNMDAGLLAVAGLGLAERCKAVLDVLPDDAPELERTDPQGACRLWHSLFF